MAIDGLLEELSTWARANVRKVRGSRARSLSHAADFALKNPSRVKWNTIGRDPVGSFKIGRVKYNIVVFYDSQAYLLKLGNPKHLFPINGPEARELYERAFWKDYAM